MFTFAIITYNHEYYIIEHLESIKYQITQYGTGHEFELVLSDDHSKDKTVALATIWTERNAGLFKSVKILTTEVNQGTVKNYLKTLNNTSGEQVKVLAGDDLYNQNNIFEAFRKHQIVFTPSISFSDKILKHDRFYYLKSILSKKQILLKLKKAPVFTAPGAFIDADMLRDDRFHQFISAYKWIEDWPSWMFFFDEFPNLKYQFSQTPYILYRKSSGYSNNNNSPVHQEFQIEKQKIKDCQKKYIGDMSRHFDLSGLAYRFAKFLYKDHLFPLFYPKRKQESDIQTLKAQEHLDYLRAQVKAFSG